MIEMLKNESKCVEKYVIMEYNPSKYLMKGVRWINMHLEKEVKVLDVDVNAVQKKLANIGASFRGKKEQHLYTYDVLTIYHRFLEVSTLIKSDKKLMYLTNVKKLRLLLEEATGCIADSERKEICKKYGIDSIAEIAKHTKKEILDFVDDKLVDKALKKCMINPNKWIRLRESNGRCELTVKHIISQSNDEDGFQQIVETEVTTSSFDETNVLLEALGFVRRNYQEKIRYSYSYQSVNIEIDIWPLINPYIEIECEDIALTWKIIEQLDLCDHEVVSCNTEELYRKIGIDIKSMQELKF